MHVMQYHLLTNSDEFERTLVGEALTILIEFINDENWRAHLRSVPICTTFLC